jgi:hypothetical protein
VRDTYVFGFGQLRHYDRAVGYLGLDSCAVEQLLSCDRAFAPAAMHNTHKTPSVMSDLALRPSCEICLSHAIGSKNKPAPSGAGLVSCMAHATLTNGNLLGLGTHTLNYDRRTRHQYE